MDSKVLKETRLSPESNPTPKARTAVALLHVLLAVACCAAFRTVCFRARLMAVDLDIMNIEVPASYLLVMDLAALEVPISVGLFAFLALLGPFVSLRLSSLGIRRLWLALLALLGALPSLVCHYVMASPLEVIGCSLSEDGTRFVCRSVMVGVW